MASARAGRPLPRLPVVRFVVVFAATIGAYAASLRWLHPFINERLTAWNAEAVAAVLRTLGQEATADGARVLSPLASMNVIGECTAIHPIAVFAAGLVAYPARWKPRLWGLAAGVAVLLTLNVARLVSLCYVHALAPAAFEVTHVLVWQSLLVFASVLLWLVWAVGVADGT